MQIPNIDPGNINSKQTAGMNSVRETGKVDSLFPDEAVTTNNTVNKGKAPTLDEKAVNQFATNLYTAMQGIGADGKAVDDIILNNNNLNSYDIVNIATAYRKVANGHTLLQDLSSNFMGKHQDNLIMKVLGASIELYSDENCKGTMLRRAKNILNEKTAQRYIVNLDEKESPHISFSTMGLGIRG